jgi:hypothetical protein
MVSGTAEYAMPTNNRTAKYAGLWRPEESVTYVNTVNNAAETKSADKSASATESLSLVPRLQFLLFALGKDVLQAISTIIDQLWPARSIRYGEVITGFDF